VNSYRSLGWLAPQAEPVAQNAPQTMGLAAPAAPSFDPQGAQRECRSISDAVRQSIDRIATSIAAIQERMSRDTDRIATEQIARSVARFGRAGTDDTRDHETTTSSKYVLYKELKAPAAAGSLPHAQPVLRAVTGTMRLDQAGGPLRCHFFNERRIVIAGPVLFTLLDTGHMRRRSSAAGFRSSVPDLPVSQ